MTTKNILIIGATSGIAEAVARRYAASNCNFVLVGRDTAKLDIIASDLAARGAAGVHVLPWDANDVAQAGATIAGAWQQLGTVDLALIAHGSLPDQARAEEDLAYAVEQFRLNGESAVVCMLALAQHFRKQGNGTLAVIGSVAGDRGRPTNYVYGAAKGAVEDCASGLRASLFKQGVHLLLIKPGFVATPMTAHLELPGALTASADQVAQDIQRAVARGSDVLYTRWFWRWIMLIIKSIPTLVFKRLSL